MRKTSLRVSVWESSRKKPLFRGEVRKTTYTTIPSNYIYSLYTQVFFYLNDSHIVNLQAVAKWYPICDSDPNLPPLPTPSHRQVTILNKVKATLGTSFGPNSTLRKKKKGDSLDSLSKAQSLMDISQSNDVILKNDLHSILAPLKVTKGSSALDSNRLSFLEFLSELDEESHEEMKPKARATHTRSKSSQFLEPNNTFSDSTSICSEGAIYSSSKSDFLSSQDLQPGISRPESEISQDSLVTTSSETSSSRSSDSRDYTKYTEGEPESSLMLNYWSSPKRYAANKLVRKYSFIDTLEEFNWVSPPPPSLTSPSPETTPKHSEYEASTTTIRLIPDSQERLYDRLVPKVPLYQTRRGSVDTIITTSYGKCHSNVDHPLSVTNSYSHTPPSHSPRRSPLKEKRTSTPKKEQFYRGISKSVDDIVGMDDSSMMEFDVTDDDFIIREEESSLDTPGMRRGFTLSGDGRDVISSTETTESSTHSSTHSEVFVYGSPLRNTSSDETPQNTLSVKKALRRQNNSQPALSKPSKPKAKLSPKFSYKWMSMEALIESDSSPEVEKRQVKYALCNNLTLKFKKLFV